VKQEKEKKSEEPRVAPPNPVAMRRAIADFLAAAGLDPTDALVRDTPSRVARVWTSEFLDGYGMSPEKILQGSAYKLPRSSRAELVVVADLRFHSICPHHLLPYEGRAHLAYQPSKTVVGFGRLTQLVDCFAHRLVLQEALAQNVASALYRILDCSAAACIVEARQACLRLAEHGQSDARTFSEAYEGALSRPGDLRRELWARLGTRRPQSEPFEGRESE